jgi:hypothetical protein
MSVLRRLALPGLAVVMVGAAACGSGGSGTHGVASLTGAGGATTTTTKAGKQDPQEAFLAYTRCMRGHGVSMPDPQVSGTGGGGVAVRVGGDGVDPNSPAFKTADTACRPILEKAVGQGGLKRPSQADQDRALKFARCMRDHGVPIPDPDFSGGGVRISANAGAADGGVKPDGAAFQLAQKACEHFLGPRGARGPGGAGSSGLQTGSAGGR